VKAWLSPEDVDWKPDCEEVLAVWAGGEGVAGVLSLGIVRGPTPEEADDARSDARKDVRGRRRQQQQNGQQQQEQKLVGSFYMDVAVLLPAAAHLDQQQQAAAVCLESTKSFGEFSLSITPQLHSPTLQFTLCETISKTYQGKKTPAQLTAMRTKLQERSRPRLERRAYATLAGLLKWQLPWQLKADQLSLLTRGKFAALQVNPTDGDKAVAAKPSMGLRAPMGTLGFQ
jgi:hypothetical protein